mgnify:FL=1
MHKVLFLLVTVLAVVLSADTFAANEDPNLQLIKARQGDMELRTYSVMPLFGMAKGEIPYDAEQAVKLVNNLKLLLQLL